jgi:hypothetical protein
MFQIHHANAIRVRKYIQQFCHALTARCHLWLRTFRSVSPHNYPPQIKSWVVLSAMFVFAHFAPSAHLVTNDVSAVFSICHSTTRVKLRGPAGVTTHLSRRDWSVSILENSGNAVYRGVACAQSHPNGSIVGGCKTPKSLQTLASARPLRPTYLLENRAMVAEMDRLYSENVDIAETMVLA